MKRWLAIFMCVISINVEAMADSIKKAEGNDNYGVLTKYKHTSPRQACINTINHAIKDFKGSDEREFIAFLGSRYAPVGMGKNSNDPTNLNRHWVKNVRYWYERNKA